MSSSREATALAGAAPDSFQLSAETVVLNPETLEALRALGEPGEPDLFLEFAETFLLEIPPRKAALDESIRQFDFLRAREVAHSLKGSSGNIGADRLAALFHSMDRAAAAENLSELKRLMQVLDSEWTKFLQALRELTRR